MTDEDIAELFADEWPVDICYLGWDQRRRIAVRLIELLGIEQVGWLEDADTDDPAPVKMKHGEAFYMGDVGVCVPIYRLSAGETL